MRAMPLAFPNDRLAWSFEEQYLLGPALLVAPVLQPGGAVRLYLPPGGWYDLWSGERIEGGRQLETTVSMDRFPVYGREGYMLPLGPAVQHTGELAGRASLEELLVFGSPRQQLALPGVTIEVSPQGMLEGVPPGTKLTRW